MNRIVEKVLPLLLALALLLTACGASPLPALEPAAEETPGQGEPISEEEYAPAGPEAETDSFGLESVPAYAGEAYLAVNGNQPYFSEEEYTTEAFELYSELDGLGRCGVTYANICEALMPTEERGDISRIHPTGWVQNQYDFVEGKSLYNRCHLIGFQLAGENDNEKNLITGTRYLNTQGMLPFENMVADYVKETRNHVLYRVTPVFEGDNLVASGVLMEAWSVEDEGEGICFCVYAYNVQPGVEIDYATGENRAEEGASEPSVSSGEMEYVLNVSSHKFHNPDCSGAAGMSEANRQDYTGTREELIAQGYEPCGNCKP